MLEYIKNIYNNWGHYWYHHWYHQEPIIIPPKRDKTCALTYHSDFIDIDENTNICEYKEALVCQEKNTCALIEEYMVEEYMKLSEVRINKHIYFHDQAGNAKTYVHNMNSNGGTVYVNLSIKE